MGLAARHNDCRPRTRCRAIPERHYNESDERLHGRRKLGRKIAKHLTAASLPDRANGNLVTAQLHGRAPPGGSPQLVRRPVDGNRPATASRRFGRREHRPRADEREAAPPIASQLERTAVEVARDRLSEAATRPQPAVAIVIAERVAGSPPTDPLDHEHRVTLPQPPPHPVAPADGRGRRGAVIVVVWGGGFAVPTLNRVTATRSVLVAGSMASPAAARRTAYAWACSRG